MRKDIAAQQGHRPRVSEIDQNRKISGGFRVGASIKVRTRRSHGFSRTISAAIEEFESRQLLTGTWTALTNPAPSTTGTSTTLLLTDGTVMVNGGGISNQWFKLTPDSTGGYANGTWTTLAPMSTARRFYGSAVLTDGRVLIVGGEDSGPAGSRNFSNLGEIYNPVTNSWSNIPNLPQEFGGDLVTETLPDGRVIAGNPVGVQTEIFNPVTNRWSPGPDKLDHDNSDEETWVKLPDGSILSYNVNGSPQHAQRYVPALNAWYPAGDVALQPVDNTELGPALLLPDGRVFFTGATGQSAYYTPPATLTGAGIWTMGPVFPNGLGPNDAPAAELVNGHVLIAAGATPVSGSSTEVFDFDPATNIFTQVTTPAAMNLSSISPVFTRMMDLPSGQVLFTANQNTLYLYTPTGSPLNSWRPTISSITPNGGGIYTLTGTQLNGLSEGANFGDDAQSATNYPIIEFTAANGVVKFARTFHWNTTSIATGSTSQSVQFTLPAGVSNVNSVTVVANGIASAPVLYCAGATAASNDTITISGSTSAGSAVVNVTEGGVASSWHNIGFVIAAAGDGNDTYNVNSTLAGIPVFINGGSGNDTINVTPGGTKVSAIKSALTVNGGSGSNTLNVNDGSDVTGVNWTITSSSISTSNSAAITISNLQTFNLFGGTGGATFNVNSTAAGTVWTIQGGAASDSFNVTPDTLFVDNLQGALNVDGGGGNNSLQVDDQSNPYNDTWNITSQGLSRNAAASIGLANFHGVTLKGGGESAGLTTYNVMAMPASTGLTINAGTGPGLLQGPNLNSSWSITGADSGSLGNIAFTGMSYLTGGTANDSFQFGAGGSLSGDLNGGDGTNTIAMAANTNHWEIERGNAGTVNGMAFRFIQNLVGGTGNDQFAFAPSGLVIGSIDGGAGDNTVDYSSRTSGVLVNLQTKVATSAGGGISHIDNFIGTGSASSLFVSANVANTWQIAGNNSGSVGTVTFSNFPNLTGGALNDLFQFSSAGLLTGTLAGAGGTNTLDYSSRNSSLLVNLQTSTATSVGKPFSNLNALIGGSGTNSLVGTNSTSTWTLSGSNAGTLNGTFTFSGVGNLTGGSANDTFAMLAAGSASGAINGGGGVNTLDYSTRTTGVVVNLATNPGTATSTGSVTNFQNVIGTTAADTINAGSSGGALSGNGGNDTLVGGSGADTFIVAANQGSSTTIDGGTGSNSVIGANAVNSWNISGINSGSLNGITLTNIQKLSGGTSADTFTIGPAGNITGSIAGGGGSDTLIAANAPNLWSITAGNAGNLNGLIFSGILNLTGGTGSDSFAFGSAGFLGGAVNGGGGTDTLDYSARAAGILANLQTHTATGLSTGFSQISSLKGAPGSILTGANTANIWNITATNTGNINGEFSFSSVAGLVGGTANDIFRFSDGSSVSGTINGGTGNGGTGNGDWLDFSACSNALTINLTTGTATHTGGVANIQNVHGGNGGDSLTGNSTGNILVGGGGADFITGGNGRSLLIGGNGLDKITGGTADDLLVEGFTDLDTNLTALALILAEWQSSNSYAVRISHIKGNTASGLNGAGTLTSGGTVHDDGAAGTVTGSQGLDWFFTGVNDTITDPQLGEQMN